MSESKFIARKLPDVENADSFTTLKQEGLRLVQELSGNFWTDYNLHDPGVTILDQLCYALTDLMSRTEWETADYLTGKDGGIDFNHQVLYPPHQIFPSRPITINDYRKILFDAIPESDNVWLQPAGGDQTPGLYRMVVKLLDGLDGVEAHERDGERERVIAKVRDIYAAHQNLGEDMLREVHIVDPQYYTLHGTVEIDSTREPADILADIYFQCARHIGPGIVMSQFEDPLRQGKRLEDILTGPTTQHGYIDEEALDQARQAVGASDLIGLVAAIEGVKEIHSLWLEDRAGRRVENLSYDASLQSLPYLQFPPDDNAVGVGLYRNERAYHVALPAVRRRFDRRHAEYQRLRQTGQNFASIYDPPQGEFRQLRDYFSIQHHFPESYGINAYGVPRSAPRRRAAQASQLKAYLLFFEQIMANFLANVHAIPQLFSLDNDLRRSYFYQVLTNQNVPDVEHLYQDKVDQVDANVAQIVGQYDPFVDRRNRILDYLLGMYGEKFTQRSLRNFNYYFTHHELGHELIRNKMNFLTHLVDISQKRAGAFNYTEVSWNTDNVSILQKKISILLGLKYFYNRSLVSAFTHQRLKRLISDSQFIIELESAYLGMSDDEMNQYLHDMTSDKTMEKDIQTLFAEISVLKHSLLSASMLRSGIHLERYRVVSREEDETYQVVFQPDEGARWYYLASYRTREEAEGSANDFRRLLIDLNWESEGVYLIEHLLLRPTARQAHPISVPDDFYTFTISVIFPSWTARFNDNAFRQLAEETVRLNCPAHIYPTFYWLDFEAIRAFETLYKTWLHQVRGSDANGAALDTAAEHLIAFLLRHRANTAG